jgi:hypothetical protein
MRERVSVKILALTMGLMILISFLPKTSGDGDPLNLVNSSFVYYVNKFTNYNEK